VSGDFAISGISDASFDAIADIVVMLVDVRGNANFQFTFGVELSGLFGDLISGVVARIFRVAFFSKGLPGRGLLFVAFYKGRPVRERVNDVLHIGSGDRLAKIVFGFERGFDEVALKNTRSGNRDFNFVLGLFVLLDVEATVDGVTLAAVTGDGDRIIAKRSCGREIEIAVDGAEGRNGKWGLKNRLAGRVLDEDLDLFATRNFETLAGASSENGFEVDGVRGAIDGAVGVDVSGPVFGGIAADVIGVGRDQRDVVVVDGENADILVQAF
jgi:hypothetical protein